MMTVEEIIREVPELSEGVIGLERLNGGLSNLTYKVATPSGSYVLRVNNTQNEFLSLTRASEVDVMKLAYREGFGPRVVASSRPEQYVVTEFLGECRMVAPEDYDEVKGMMIERLRQIHRFEGIARMCSPYHLIDGYLKGAAGLGVREPEGLGTLLRRVESIAHQRSSDKMYTNKYCHNDAFACNMLYDGRMLRVIDWELSGYGDVFFDLAIIPFSGRFTEAQEKEWLQLYFGDYEEEQYLILQDMKFVNMVREAAWGLLYAGLSRSSDHHDFDYYRHAEYAIDRIEQGEYTL
jgi:thiamine kinase-like enzyme